MSPVVIRSHSISWQVQEPLKVPEPVPVPAPEPVKAPEAAPVSDAYEPDMPTDDQDDDMEDRK